MAYCGSRGYCGRLYYYCIKAEAVLVSIQIEAMRMANLGKKRSQETRDKISYARQIKEWDYARTPPSNPCISDKAMVNKHSCIWVACIICGRERWVRTKRGGLPVYDICGVCINRLPEMKQAKSQKQWGTIERRMITIQRLMKAQNRKPNKPECIMLNLLNHLYPNEWRYVGDGQLVIEGRNPDFVNCNGKKLIIECFGNYWHSVRTRCFEETEEGRIALFKKYGYKTLVVWEREIKNTDTLVARIREFVG